MRRSKITLDLGDLLRRVHPRTYRIALAVSHDRAAGMRVVARVFGHSSVMLGRWETPDEADRWFMRYTVLCSRDQKSATHQDNALISVANSPACKAAVLAVWHLPMQQREAFLLHHGENLDLRQLAMAMDCSSSAAKNHLAAAEDSLRPVLGKGLSDFTADLPGLMQQLLPPAERMEVAINAMIRRRRRTAWMRRWILTPAKWIATALVGGVVWKMWKAHSP